MPDKSPDSADQAFLSTNIKGLLQDVLEKMDARNTELRGNTAFANATPAEARLFAFLRGRERSISELARAMGVTRQAVHHTVHRLIDAGVVELVAAEHSRREKRVRITEAGQKVRAVSASNLRQIETEIEGRVGKDKVSNLRNLLIELRDNGFPEQD